jgi:hypothetical protein
VGSEPGPARRRRIVIATLIKKTIIRARSNRGQPPLFGPDLDSVSAADRTVIPSGIAIATAGSRCSKN